MFPSQVRGVLGLPIMARRHGLAFLTLLLMLLGASSEVLAHAVAEGDTVSYTHPTLPTNYPV